MSVRYEFDRDGTEALLSSVVEPVCLPAAERIASACRETGGDYGASVVTGRHTQPKYARVRTNDQEAANRNAAHNYLAKNIGRGSL